jgi:hypothetical protein
MRFLRAVLLPLLAGLGLAQEDDGVFINPAGPQRELANTPVYTIGSTVQLRWTVSWDRISLTLYQNGNPDFEYLLREPLHPHGLPHRDRRLTVTRSQRLQPEQLQLDRLHR